MAQFEKVFADVKLVGPNGTVAIAVEGKRVPDGPKEVGLYIGQRVAESLAGITDAGAEGMKDQVGKLEGTIAEKDAEIKQLENELKEIKKAARVKRATPAA